MEEVQLIVERTLPAANEDALISLAYGLTRDLVFNASLNWDGSSEIFAPGFITPGNFQLADTPAPLPPRIDIESIDGDHSQVGFSLIWGAIDDLSMVDFALQDKTKLGLLLYQFSTDPVFSENWDWIVFLFNQ